MVASDLPSSRWTLAQLRIPIPRRRRELNSDTPTLPYLFASFRAFVELPHLLGPGFLSGGKEAPTFGVDLGGRFSTKSEVYLPILKPEFRLHQIAIPTGV